MRRSLAFALVALFVMSLALAACAPASDGQPAAAAASGSQPSAANQPAAASAAKPVSSSKSEVPMAPLSGMPEEVQAAPASVRTAYQFAVANPDALKNVPCYCGCGSMGHTSNLSCYVKSFKDDGTVAEFDGHALGCSLCVDISTDVMRMIREGKSPANIRQEIVAAYSKFGPANQ